MEIKHSNMRNMPRRQKRTWESGKLSKMVNQRKRRERELCEAGWEGLLVWTMNETLPRVTFRWMESRQNTMIEKCKMHLVDSEFVQGWPCKTALLGVRGNPRKSPMYHDINIWPFSRFYQAQQFQKSFLWNVHYRRPIHGMFPLPTFVSQTAHTGRLRGLCSPETSHLTLTAAQ